MKTKYKKILLVAGDSFTDPEFKSMFHPELDTSWIKWPEIIAKKLNMTCVNLGRCGAGNEQIYYSLADYIFNKDRSNIGLVIAAWSQSHRRDWQFKNNKDELRWRNTRLDEKGDIFYWTKRSLRYFTHFQLLCEYFKLPYKQFQMIPLFEGYLYGLKKNDWEIKENINNKDFSDRHVYKGNYIIDKKMLIKMIMQNDKLINNKNFIGWPLTYELGGYSIENKTTRSENGQRIKDLVISDMDLHPNDKGQQKIAEFIYARLG